MLTALLLAAAAPAFDPLRFFAGQTQGEGQLKIPLRRRTRVAVDGSGRAEPNGSLLLDQTVREGTKRARIRHWHLRRTAVDRYEGTLSDARGLVTAEVDGSRLHLRFTSRSGFKVQRWLTLSADGRSADNLLRASRFGVTVATLHERISKVD